MRRTLPFPITFVLSLWVMVGCAPRHPGFEIAGDGGSAPLEWAVSPRPAPLPPLDHAAMLLRVTVPGVPAHKPLYLQLDLGHTSTLLHADAWASIAECVPGADPRHARGVKLALGSITLDVRELPLRASRGRGIAWNDSTPVVIGTLGSDVLAGRTLVLDLRADSVSLTRSRASVLRTHTPLQPYREQLGRIVLPARLEGRDLHVMYDSGTSAFAWVTDDRTWRRLAKPGAVVQKFPVNSWGRPLPVHVTATDASVRIAGRTFALGDVTRFEGVGWLQDLGVRMLGVNALMGNRLFLGHRVVIDANAHEFGLDD